MNDPDLAGTEIQIFSTYRLGLIGIYNLTSSAKGFGAPKRKGFRVQVNQQARVDITLEVGEVKSTPIEDNAAPSLS